MNRINILQMLLAVALLGSCSINKVESSESTETSVPSSQTAISFSADEQTADWSSKASTRGVAVTNDNFTEQLSSIMVYAFMTNPGSITSCYIEDEAASYSATAGVWSFSPAQYYPIDYTIDFLAYTPEGHYASDSDNNGISHTYDFDDKELLITYSAPTTARNQPDLMLATPQTMISESNHLEDLEFNHALTQISMSACVGEGTESGRYVITRFTMHDITIKGSLTYSVENGIGQWSADTDGEFVTSAMLPNSDLGEDPVELTSDMQLIMSNGHTLFMIPQAIEGKSTAPTIQITISDTHYTLDADSEEETDTYLTYRTDKLTLPSYNGEGWKAGEHINLQFEFEVDENNIVIPLSFTAKLLDWVETTVNKEIDANIYAYLSVSSIAASGGSITLYTNGEVKSVTFDGSDATYAATDGGYQVTIPSSNSTDDKTLTVEIGNSDDSTITKNFTITVTE